MPIARLRSSTPALALAFSVSLAALWPCSAAAQSLIQLYDAAHAYDATYLAARAQYESAPYRVDQTRALLRPNVALGASAGQVKAYLENNPNPSNSSYGVTVTGRQPILNQSNRTTIAQSERSLVSSLADFDAAEQDLMLRVSQAYFDVLGAQDTLATTRASKAAIAEQLASAKRNFEVGTATITDTREAQARFDLATAQEIAADNDLVTKRIALDQLVGRSNVAPRQLAVPVVLPPPHATRLAASVTVPRIATTRGALTQTFRECIEFS
jgi:outer membrane protein